MTSLRNSVKERSLIIYGLIIYCPGGNIKVHIYRYREQLLHTHTYIIGHDILCGLYVC